MTKPIVKICYKLLYVIVGVKSIFDEVTSWPQLISKLLVASACLHAASDWPSHFFTPKVFFSILYTCKTKGKCAGYVLNNQTLIVASFIHRYSCTHKLGVTPTDDLCSIFHAVLMLPQ